MRRIAAVFLFLTLAASTADAKLASSELSNVGASPQHNAELPLDIPLRNEREQTKRLDDWIANLATVWVLVDFTCKTLCGPIASVVAQDLRQTGLKAGSDFRFVVLGFDPKDTADKAIAMHDAQVGTDDDLGKATLFLRANAPDAATLTKAFGFQAVYDSEYDQYAHPAVAFITTPDGHIARELPALGLDPANLRLAIVDASHGRTGTWTDHIRLMCYGFDPVSGRYTPFIGRILAGVSILTIVCLILLITSLLWRERSLAKH